MRKKVIFVMVSSYSKDLRESAIKYVEGGHSYSEGGIIFNVSDISIKRWHKQYLELGHCSALRRLGKKPRIELSEFEDYVKENPDKTLGEIGEHFKMSDVGALYYIRKIGFRYKKKSLAIKKRARKEGKTI